MQQSGRFGFSLMRALLGLCLLLAGPLPAAAAEPDVRGAGGIAVVYPDLVNPYRDIFDAIIAGIEERTRLRRYPLASPADAAGLGLQLHQQGVKVVIALGRQGLRATSGLDRDIGVVVGGVLSVPEAEQRRVEGISLTPDPGLLFARLKSLAPGVKRVIVVYNPQHNGWLLALAQAAAKSQGLELVAHEARDLGTALRLYEAAFATADGRRDALWLPQDPTTVDEDTILPFVLRRAWGRSVPVFSSSFPHVKKGALFALYPDNRALGRALAERALDQLAGGQQVPGLVPLQSVLTAVNLRTASHLDLNIGQHHFDFVFPEP